MELRYFRDINRREVDFVIVKNSKPIHFIESETSGKVQSPSLRYLKERFPSVPATQVTLDAGLDVLTKDNIRIRSADKLLATLV